jgi:hypothetical protein
MEEGKTPSKIEGAIERLNQDPYLLATISAVPVVGGSITQVLTGIGQQIVQERNKRLFEQLTEHMATVEEQAIKRDYLKTPEGFDLLIKALDESRRTRSEAKRDLIARILAGATSTVTGQSEYSPEEYLSIVASLTPRELQVARTLYDLQKDISLRELEPDNRMETWRSCVESMREKHAIDTDELPLLLNRIASTGLVDLIYVQYPGSPAPTYWVSAAFHKLMELLRLEET